MGMSKSYKGGATGEGYGKTNQVTQTKTRTTAQGSVQSGYAEGESRQQGKGGMSYGGSDRATYGGSRKKPGKGYGK